MTKRNYASVVLVGRTNVGKSTLFNRLSDKARSIVFDAPGVTRDFITDEVTWQNRVFTLIDTGGIRFEKTTDIISQEVQARALACMEAATLVLFVCDAQVGLLPEDRQIAKMLHKKGFPVALIVNKVDTKNAQHTMHDFVQLGFETIISISAIHAKGIAEVLEFIVGCLGERALPVETERTCKVVLLGKPNVGKSSLLNLLLQQERSIVSDVPGTTREPIVERIRFYHEDIVLTDTAGVRRKRSVEDPLEQLMAKSTLQAVKHADVILLMVDAAEGQLADQELKLAFYVFEQQNKALILLFNKQDLVVNDAYAKERLHADVREYKFLTDKVEQLSISCKTGANVGKILPLVQKIWQRYNQTFVDTELSLFLREALEHKPLYHNQMSLILYKVQQIKSAPITIVLYVNEPSWFGSSQLLYFDNQLRKKYDLKSIPLVLIPRKKK